ATRPLAVSREEIMMRNPRLAGVMLALPPGKSAKLARQVAEITRKPGPDAADMKSFNAAANKRARRLERNLKAAQAGGIALAAPGAGMADLPEIVGAVA
ncbi:MAG: hypothetical protein KDE45_22620, partial [Caldilineaceae bacterium]|nr:hypothetical protein [Caldilineaceae bacterium]